MSRCRLREGRCERAVPHAAHVLHAGPAGPARFSLPPNERSRCLLQGWVYHGRARLSHSWIGRGGLACLHSAHEPAHKERVTNRGHLQIEPVAAAAPGRNQTRHAAKPELRTHRQIVPVRTEPNWNRHIASGCYWPRPTVRTVRIVANPKGARATRHRHCHLLRPSQVRNGRCGRRHVAPTKFAHEAVGTMQAEVVRVRHETAERPNVRQHLGALDSVFLGRCTEVAKVVHIEDGAGGATIAHCDFESSWCNTVRDVKDIR